MVEGVLRCRTCDAPVSRIEGVVAFCERCADRTPVKCPQCRGRLRSRPSGLLVCVCERCWRVDGERLVESVSQIAALGPAPALRAPASSSGVIVREIGPRLMRGYRDSSGTATIELDVATRRRLRGDGSEVAVVAAIGSLGAAVGGWLAHIDALGALGFVAFMALAGLSKVLRGGSRWPRRPGWITARRMLRIGPEKLEIYEDLRWWRIMRTSEVRAIVRERSPSDPERAQIAVQTADGARFALFDGVAEADAAEIEARSCAHLQRLRAR